MTPTGAKRWFVKYRFGGKEKRLALDTNPGATFKAAREGGSDPVQVCQAEKLTKAATGATGDEAVSREFHCVKAAGRSEGHATKWLRMNERPHIGSLRLSTIKAPSLLATLRQKLAGVLAERLIARVPYLDKVFFANSGSEAVESAIKFSRAATGKPGIVFRGNDLGNVISGGNASDQLFGRAGDDTLVGGKGNDRYEGGAGDDGNHGRRPAPTARPRNRRHAPDPAPDTGRGY